MAETKFSRRWHAEWVGVVVLFLFVLLFLLFAPHLTSMDERWVSRRGVEVGLESESCYDLYGLDTVSHSRETVMIPEGALLGTLFQTYGVSAELLDDAVNSLDSVFPVRRIRAGNPLHFYYALDDSLASYCVYRHSAEDYVLLDFISGDGVLARVGSLPFERELSACRVRIESSLWNAFSGAGVRPDLALTLSEIFAWTVDFFGLQRDDVFEVLYYRNMIGGNEVGVGPVVVAHYISGGDTVDAYSFAQDSVMCYWDSDGNSIRKAFLKAPLNFTRISSGFSYARRHPILKVVRPHTGVDYAAPAGTPVVALGDGVVVAREYQRGGGNVVKIRHNSLYTTGYLHLSSFGSGIRPGVRVVQGQVIGYVGSTGLSTGPHLDFRVWRGGVPVNPLRLESPSLEPVDSVDLPRFMDSVRYQDSLLYAYLGPNLVAGGAGICVDESEGSGEGLDGIRSVR